ncbi:MATH and LRR domain-containing protein PFE0570w-like [Daktulosphaira vitifoliae]|uniref:MATH and LRR domain-containing protein PFE0570w-like n=1 Tax=Daktulosphaira vitifoliae TaxID=58002 RepID=UPI0021AA8486|nr:MATH and LRR domain-containing protein PFE0570w-like [Daktulosphaira vitifoliae]
MNFYTFIFIFVHCLMVALATNSSEENSSESDTPITDNTEVYLGSLFGLFVDDTNNINAEKLLEINETNCQNDQEIIDIIKREQKDDMVDYTNIVKEKCATLRTVEKKLNDYSKEHDNNKYIDKAEAVELINTYGRKQILCRQIENMMVKEKIDDPITNKSENLARMMMAIKLENESAIGIPTTCNNNIISKEKAIELINSNECQINFEKLKYLLLTYNDEDEYDYYCDYDEYEYEDEYEDDDDDDDEDDENDFIFKEFEDFDFKLNYGDCDDKLNKDDCKTIKDKIEQEDNTTA